MPKAEVPAVRVISGVRELKKDIGVAGLVERAPTSESFPPEIHCRRKFIYAAKPSAVSEPLLKPNTLFHTTPAA